MTMPRLYPILGLVLLVLAYSRETGPVLVDMATGRLLPVRSGWQRHPLDVYLDDREGREGSTADMVQWASEAAALWRQEMSRIHRFLLARASPAVRERLIDAQARWEKFEEAERAWIMAIDQEEQGTIGRIIAAGRRLALVRERALHLYTFLE